MLGRMLLIVNACLILDGGPGRDGCMLLLLLLLVMQPLPHHTSGVRVTAVYLEAVEGTVLPMTQTALVLAAAVQVHVPLVFAEVVATAAGLGAPAAQERRGRLLLRRW